ncbi:hypothetical protein [Candidatus Enterococcus mansonii]|uniref:Uncharacterized protein n=1 Tax=Candidatus Enterococcus mansonii TaxID=1834181 RepID=A0A242BYV5_9ENTE|nr:hypothetical protein [Enterococcus sp. 4G2_DIV0659]OTO03048.1 hypothetical protein A5880_003159 [Enterococcus sp. 4G2_DIV0659]
MIDSKNQWKRSLVEFLLLFVIYEVVLLFEVFVIIKMIVLQAVNPPIIGFMFENVKEGIRQINFIDFLDNGKGLCVLLTFFSTVLALGSMD